jgi:crotonobetainyl-CoA:carnitine CoA-transferase CaiB-like acyl-CoA transferase
MPGVMEGVRVLEVALYGLVPTTGAVLSDWGAEVIKVELPEYGDPIRGLTAWGIAPGTAGVTYLWEVFNRGKRSVGVDIDSPEGLAIIMRLVDESDVFLTNFLEPARKRLGIDVEDVVSRNPRIIYGRGSGHGPLGPDADKGGFDGISYWARTGAGTAAMPADYAYPIPLPGPAFGDIQTGMHLAGGIAAALFRRERTGKGAVVDASLLASGMWAMQASIAGSFVSGANELPRVNRKKPGNPLANVYRTSDGRYVSLAMLEADRYWPGFCEAIGRSELVTDPRFESAALRLKNVDQCVDLLDEIFEQKTFDEWKKVLNEQEGQWTSIQRTSEVLDDEQAEVNGYIKRVAYGNGTTLPLVSVPVQIDGETAELRPAPELGAHTEDTLLSLGKSWDELVELKERSIIS